MQGEMSGSEKKKTVNENSYDISSTKGVTKKFLEMYKKTLLHGQSCFFG